MTLQQYQDCYVINNNTKDEIERMAMLICTVYDLQPDKVDLWSAKKFAKYIYKIEHQFKKVQSKPFYWWRKHSIDAFKFTFGQFIEMQTWCKTDATYNLHLVAATISKSKKDHSIKAEWYKSHNVRYCLADCLAAIDSLTKLVHSYKGLFEIEEIEEDNFEEYDKQTKLKAHPFIEKYGWLYAAERVAEHNRISINEVYELPIIQALNDLSYLKSKQDYNKQMSR